MKKQILRKKVLVIGYINLNVGDDCFFDILFKRYPNVDFYFFPPSVLLESYLQLFKKYNNVIMYDKNETYLKIRQDITDVNVPLNLFPMICECAKAADVFINIGGSIFIENDNWKNDDRFILKNLMEGKPSFVIGCNFPFSSQEYQEYYEKWFQTFTDICFRDNKSYNRFQASNNYRVANDIVFCLKKKKSIFPLPRRKIVGMSIINLDGRKNLEQYKNEYLQYYINKSKEYIALGYQVYFFTFCPLEGDKIAINTVINNLTAKEIQQTKVIEYQGDLVRFLKQFKKCRLIIGSRLHSIILAITNNQDFIPVSYGDKIDNILKEIDDNIEIIKIDNKISSKSECSKIYNFSNSKFNSNDQFKIMDQYLEEKRNSHE